MIGRRFWPQLYLLLAVLAVPAPTFAQTGTGVITGTVTDPSKAVLPQAVITLTNKATNVVQTTTTSSAGIFRFPAVLVGEYRLTADVKGFEKAEIATLNVAVGETTNADLVLKVSGQTQVVQVTSEAAEVQTASAQVQTLINTQDVENLPLNGRNFVQLEALEPNAVPMLRTSVTATRGGYNIIANAPVQTVASNIDGINQKELTDPRTTILLNLDVIDEFQSATQNYSAAEGGAGGAQINLVMKSGTNAFHGTLYEYLRNVDLDARNFFDPHIKAPYIQNQFGATFGGRIIKNKLFFYDGYEGLRIAQSVSSEFSVPTVAEREGNFQGLPTIYDPMSYSAATNTRQPFPNNMIPPSEISPISQKAAQLLYPLPNLPSGPGGADDLVGAKPNDQTKDQGSTRMDYTPTSVDSFFMHYIYFGDLYHTGANASLPNFADNYITPAHNAALGYTRILSPSLVNQFRLGFFRFTQILEDAQANVPIDQEIGITGTSKMFLGNPVISVTGINTTGPISNSPNNRVDNAYYLYDDFSLTRGRHAISVGYDMAVEQFNGGENPFAKGDFSFTNQYTEQIGQASTGVAAADFLLGFPATSEVGLGAGFQNWRQDHYGTYVQDDWKMKSNLTINLGLRYEYTQPQYAIHHEASGFYDGMIVQLGTDGVPPGLTTPYRKDFMPRLGIAYRPRGSQKLVVRTGYGITFVPLTFLDPAFSMVNNPPGYLEESFVGNTPIPNLTLANAFPAGLGTTSTTLSTIQGNFRDGYIQQWNAGVQRELVKKITLEVDYVGNKGSQLPYTQNINASPAGPGNVQNKRPWPQFGPITSTNSFARSTYESMVVKSQKRFSGGFTYLASYTWAHGITTPDQDLIGDGASSSSVRNPLNPDADKGPDYFDIRSRFVASGVYDLPFGKGRLFGTNWPGLVDNVIGGWRFNAILTLQTGYPLTPALGIDNANVGSAGQSRPNAICNPNTGPRTVKEWFNTSCFALPALYSYGNAGTGIIVGPPTRQLDISLQRQWQLVEKASLVFRADVFDIFNTPQFNQPAATFTASTFGVISSAGDPREFQFALRLVF